MRVLALLLALGAAKAACPNKCNGHGDCGSSDICTCFPNWVGADCADRECAFGLSWTSEGTGVVPAGRGLGGAKPYAECSAKGVCDRGTGECQCFEGYEGKGCRRHKCPNDCSQNGRCVYNEQANSTYTADLSGKFSTQYWDARAARVCACDRGWEGVDCSQRICPKGDDPVTDCASGGTTDVNSNSHNMVQRLYVRTQESGTAGSTTCTDTGMLQRADEAARTCLTTDCDTAATDYTANACKITGKQFYGYIALKYTDMFGGEYFTRPILVDTSIAATQPLRAIDRAFQWEKTKDFTYCASTSLTAELNWSSGELKGGKCDGTANNAGDQSFPAVNDKGFYLGGGLDSADLKYGLRTDEFRKPALKRFTADRIRDALQDLPNFAIPSVNVTNYHAPDGEVWGNVFDITFADAATAGEQPLLECVFDDGRACDGAQPKLHNRAIAPDITEHAVQHQATPPTVRGQCTRTSALVLTGDTNAMTGDTTTFTIPGDHTDFTGAVFKADGTAIPFSATVYDSSDTTFTTTVDTTNWDIPVYATSGGELVTAAARQAECGYCDLDGYRGVTNSAECPSSCSVGSVVTGAMSYESCGICTGTTHTNGGIDTQAECGVCNGNPYATNANECGTCSDPDIFNKLDCIQAGSAVSDWSVGAWVPAASGWSQGTMTSKWVQTVTASDTWAPEFLTKWTWVPTSVSDTPHGSSTSTTFVESCTVSAVAIGSKSYEENSECSNRGTCDGGSGICTCFEGHTGESCATQTVFF